MADGQKSLKRRNQLDNQHGGVSVTTETFTYVRLIRFTPTWLL